MKKPALAFLLLLLYFPCLDSVFAASPVIIAGGNDNESLLPEFLKLSGGSSAKICIIGSSRESKIDQEISLNAYREYFIKVGIPDHNIFTPLIMSQEDANTDEIINVVKKSTGILFTGGSQRFTLIRILHSRLHQTILQQIRSNNLVFFGTSAGAACVGQVCITGDDEYKEGLGILKEVITDQHFSQRKRQGRLKKALTDHKEFEGYGIDEATALIIENDKKRTVGTGKVYYYSDQKTMCLGN